MNPSRSRRPLLPALTAVALAVLLTGAALPASATTSDETGTTSAAAESAAAAAPTVDRIGGADRFAVAVNVSKEGYPDGNGVAYLVTGLDYPDALGAAPAAVHTNGPLLLTTRDTIPPVVLGELNRLKPNLVIIVGGPNTVSAAVQSQLAGVVSAPAVTRVQGTDRYDTSRKLFDYAFGSAVGPIAYVATGRNFPDALSAGAAAGSVDAPVVLVDGAQGELDAATSGTLTAHNFTTIKVAGGPAAVSPGIVSDLDYLFDSVVRLSGADRYQSSIAINRDGFTASGRVFLATGSTFPDALAGAALAGKLDAPLFVVPSTCVPPTVLTEISNLKATRVTLLGGPAALAPSVQALQPCSGPE
ncbi:cell wall-binding repeat-containing protein [Herbiconiux sp. VKM Ac-2851]|uniref:cell wall-binding repeat-containing protein n=1 Tax=Herbiconiux sp. VKM Ac-2851 TaxID=2739025 RepID=UPI001564484B|nr:cell wall-binding repeat-containing protein [Herbiconiux sp. VKM Ac-2851]NQX33343.1 cell wall-binding repeat-containing protein [Herbiconiux sp. VKM Ac-2851]